MNQNSEPSPYKYNTDADHLVCTKKIFKDPTIRFLISLKKGRLYDKIKFHEERKPTGGKMILTFLQPSVRTFIEIQINNQGEEKKIINHLTWKN